MLRNLFSDTAFAFRMMAAKPAFTLVVILTLAVGIGANIAMFSTIYTSLLQPLPFPDAERLVMGRATFSGRINPVASAPDYFDYRDQSTAFESLAAIQAYFIQYPVTGAEEPEEVSGGTLSWNLFQTLGVSPRLGRSFTREEGLEEAPDVVIISHGYWQHRFGGSPDAVGRTLVIEAKPHTIVGVMPAGFHFLHPVDLWRSMREGPDLASTRRFHNWLLVGRLGPSVTLSEAQGQVDVISERLQEEYPDSNTNKALLLTGLHEVLVEGFRPGLTLLMVAIGLVLLIACANVAGLLLARGSTRRGELAIRTALGASGSRLISQLLSESVALSLAGGAVGLVLAVWLQRLIVDFMSIDTPGITQAGITAPTMVFALVLSLATGVLFGIVPALRGAGGDVVQDLKAGGRTSEGGGTKFRNGLVIAQVALSVVLLVGSGLLIRSFAQLRSVDPGFDTSELLTAEIQLPPTKYTESKQRVRFFSRLLEEVRALPGVVGAGAINQLPIRDPGNNAYVYAAERPPTDPGDRQLAFQRAVLPGYFKLMGIPLLMGRPIEEIDREDAPRVIIINETMARTLFPGENPIGKMVVADFRENVTAEVVGVVGDVRMSGLANASRMAMYSAYPQRAYSRMRIAIRTHGEPESTAGAFRSAVWNLDRDIPVAELASMDEVLSNSVVGFRNMALSLTLFSSAALLLASLGLYGVLAFYVTQRRQEIGVRIALGASSTNIVSLVLRRGMALVTVGLVAGFAGALWATRLIQQLLFGVESNDPVTFAAVSFFFALVACVACLIPAWRAVRVDPVLALQTE